MVASLQTVSRVAEGSSMGQLSSLLVLSILGLSVQGQQTQGAVAGAAAGAKQSVLDPAQYPVCVSSQFPNDPMILNILHKHLKVSHLVH